MTRTYSELVKLQTFRERYDYLRVGARIGDHTFGDERYLNQNFYRSSLWRSIRDEVIVRDNGCDLGLAGYEIFDKIIVHHMNPITPEDLDVMSPLVLDPRYLISVSLTTHNAIHYGDPSLLVDLPPERRRNDTIPWR